MTVVAAGNSRSPCPSTCMPYRQRSQTPSLVRVSSLQRQELSISGQMQRRRFCAESGFDTSVRSELVSRAAWDASDLSLGRRGRRGLARDAPGRRGEVLAERTSTMEIEGNFMFLGAVKTTAVTVPSSWTGWSGRWMVLA